MTRVALVQFRSKTGDFANNLARSADWLAEAAAQQADLVVFPELWLSGCHRAVYPSYLKHLPELITALAGLACQHQLWLAGGSLLPSASGAPTNSLLVFNDQGEQLSPYHKLHLFSMTGEDKQLAAGHHPVTYATPLGQLGGSICYDIRFPELFRHYALAGCQAVLVPAAFHQPRGHHWRTLLRARAIENQLFILAANQVGSDEWPSQTMHYCGESTLIDPNGEILCAADTDSETLLIAELDWTVQTQARERMPVLADRRTDLYTLSWPTCPPQPENNK